jgi:hypothetical protein
MEIDNSIITPKKIIYGIVDRNSQEIEIIYREYPSGRKKIKISSDNVFLNSKLNKRGFQEFSISEENRHTLLKILSHSTTKRILEDPNLPKEIRAFLKE